MKDYTKEQLESNRPVGDAAVLVDFCLGRLYEDKTKRVMQEVVRGLTYEELIAALLLAREDLGGD